MNMNRATATPLAVLPTELLLEIAVVAAADLVADADGSLAPVRTQLARVSRAFRPALSTPAARLCILALASPLPGGDIAPFVAPGWPRGLTRAEREDLLLCWLDERVSRCRKGEMDMSAVLAFRVAKLPDDFTWNGRQTMADLGNLRRAVTNHFLTIAAIEYHLRLAKRLLALGDVPSSITFRETIRCDHGEMLRLLAAKAPPTFDQDPRKTVLAEAAGFGSLECMRVLFEMLPLDRLGTLLSGAMNRACNALNTDAIRGLIDLEAEFRPKWAICSDEPSHLLMDSVKDDWLLDVYSSFFFRTRFSAHHGILDKLVDCIRLIVGLGGSPTFALQLVSKVNCKELLCWLVARGGKLDQVPEPGRAKIRELLSGG